MSRKTATALVQVLVLFLLFTVGLAGCGDKETPASDTPSATEPADTGTDAATEPAATTPPVFTDGPGDATLTISGGEDNLGSGEFDQSELTISTGQIVAFHAGDRGTYGVKVAGLDAVTVVTGLDEFYRFDAPGSYSVEEDISGATATIIVT